MHWLQLYAADVDVLIHTHRFWFKGCFSLIVSMGITWVFGLLALHEFLLPLIYLFAIFTSLQVCVYIQSISPFTMFVLLLQGLWIFVLFVVLSHPVSSSSVLVCICWQCTYIVHDSGARGSQTEMVRNCQQVRDSQQLPFQKNTVFFYEIIT